MQAFLEGKLIYLRALSEEDITQEYTDWLNDSSVCRYNSHHRFPNTLTKTKEYVKTATHSQHNLILAICDITTNKHIGNITLQSINYIDSQAEFAILIGKVTEHTKGIGTEAATLIIQHGFEALNLHRIYCGTSVKNIPMQKLAEKLKFQKEGISKGALFKDGAYVDIINYGLINPKHF